MAGGSELVTQTPTQPARDAAAEPVSPRGMWHLAVATLERNVRLHDLIDDEIDVIIGAVQAHHRPDPDQSAFSPAISQAARDYAASVTINNEVARSIEIGHCDSGDLVRTFQRAIEAGAKGPNIVMSAIEERFPDWRNYRDLIDCIDCTLDALKKGRRL